jgi:hypothetical protein
VAWFCRSCSHGFSQSSEYHRLYLSLDLVFRAVMASVAGGMLEFDLRETLGKAQNVANVECSPVIDPYLPTHLSDWDHAFGNLTLRPAADRMRVKGNLVRTRSRYVVETYGEAMLRRLCGALPPDAAAYLADPPLAHTFCPYGPLIDVDCSIFDLAMHGDSNSMKQFGFTVSGYDLPTVYKILFKLGSPARVLRLVGVAWGLYFRPGRMMVESIEATSSRMTLHDSVIGRYLCEFGMAGWMEATVAASGAIRPRCKHIRCRHRQDPVCEWRLDWTNEA